MNRNAVIVSCSRRLVGVLFTVLYVVTMFFVSGVYFFFFFSILFLR